VAKSIYSKVKTFLKRVFREKDKSEYENASFSHEGEDRVLALIFSLQEKGFYVDAGACHPERFSNTHLLYLRGWRGINIDAMPGAMDAFKKMCPQDINLAMGIDVENGTRDLHLFEEPAINTFDLKWAERRMAAGCKRERVVKVEVRTINSILEEYLPRQTQIDLLSMDIEGLDTFVLNTLDFTRYRPKVIVYEACCNSVEDVLATKAADLLKAQGYVFKSKLVTSAIWTLNECKN